MGWQCRDTVQLTAFLNLKAPTNSVEDLTHTWRFRDVGSRIMGGLRRCGSSRGPSNIVFTSNHEYGGYGIDVSERSPTYVTCLRGFERTEGTL